MEFYIASLLVYGMTHELIVKSMFDVILFG